MANEQFGSVLHYIRQVVSPPEADSLDDGRLLVRFVDHREEAAFAALVQRHGPMVLGVCQRVLHDPHDAEDAFQATFLVLARRAAAIRKCASVGSWLYGVAYRTSQKARTGAARRRVHEQQARVMALSPSDSEVGRDDLRPLIDAELSRLPEKYRVPVVLCYLEGKTNEEAARQLGWTKGTVSGRLARARDLLRRRLGRRGFAIVPALLAPLVSESAAAAAVPPALAVSAIQAAAFAGARQALAAGVVSAKAAALAEGVLHAMTLTRLTALIVTFVLLGALGTGGALFAYRDGAGEAAPASAADKAAPAKAISDKDRLQGTWKAVSARSRGMDLPQADIEAFTMRFAGDKVVIHMKEKAEQERTEQGTFTLDTTREPRWIDVKIAAAPKLGVGIYKLEGDTLTLCMEDEDKGRPVALTSEPGTRHTLFVFHRERPAKAGGAAPGPHDTAKLKAENEALRLELQQARRQLREVQSQLEVLRAQEALARVEAQRQAQRAADQARLALDQAEQARRASAGAERALSNAHLRQLGHAMHAYVDENHQFPARAVYGKDGKPLLSWRVTLLPYMGEAALTELYKQFKLDEPWDSPHNKKLLAQMPKVFASVRGSAPAHETFYQAVIGKGTAFEGRTGKKLADFPDGAANTLVAVEAGEPVPWTKPADVELIAGQKLPPLAGLFNDGFHVLLLDGSVRFITQRPADLEQLRKLILAP